MSRSDSILRVKQEIKATAIRDSQLVGVNGDAACFLCSKAVCQEIKAEYIENSSITGAIYHNFINVTYVTPNLETKKSKKNKDRSQSVDPYNKFKTILDNWSTTPTSFIKKIIHAKKRYFISSFVSKDWQEVQVSMVINFFDFKKKKKKLFKDLDIASDPAYEKNCGNYAVLHLDFSSLNTKTSFDNAICEIREEVIAFYSNILTENEYGNLKFLTDRGDINNTVEECLKRSLGYIIQAFHKKNKKKIVVVIQNHDKALINAIIGGYYDEMANFMGSFCSKGFEMAQENIYKAIIISNLIVPSSTALSSSGLDRAIRELNHARMENIPTNLFTQDSGFSHHTVEHLINENFFTAEQPLKTRLLEKVKEFSGGYETEKKENIFNPELVQNFIKLIQQDPEKWLRQPDTIYKTNIIEKYRYNYCSSLEDFLRNLFQKDKKEIKTILHELVQQDEIKIESLLNIILKEYENKMQNTAKTRETGKNERKKVKGGMKKVLIWLFYSQGFLSHPDKYQLANKVMENILRRILNSICSEYSEEKNNVNLNKFRYYKILPPKIQYISCFTTSISFSGKSNSLNIKIIFLLLIYVALIFLLFNNKEMYSNNSVITLFFGTNTKDNGLQAEREVSYYKMS